MTVGFEVIHMNENKPIRKFAAGQVEAAIWRNNISVNGQEKTILKASISRRYKDSAGQWKTSTSFSCNEIPLATYCLRKAFEAIVELREPAAADEAAEGEERP